jgi:membrane protein insertase Oxa1/YidC/SpoIIIJ
LSWVQVILFSTIIIRLVTGLPIAIAQQRSLKRLEEIKPQIQQLAEDLKKETGLAIRKFGWDEKTAKRQYKKSVSITYRNICTSNCVPITT